jgi:hypothetical protein
MVVFGAAWLAGIHTDRAWDCFFPKGVLRIRLWPRPVKTTFHPVID